MSVNVATLPITVGVGAFLTREDRLLVVRRTYGALKGLWTIPSGYVEPSESVRATIEREVLEETGIAGRTGPLVAVRHRVAEDMNDTFLVFRMDYASGEPRADGQEVSAAEFVPMSDLASAEDSAPFTKAMIEKAPGARGMTLDPYQPPGRRAAGESYLLFL